jgi:hypothetical protein
MITSNFERVRFVGIPAYLASFVHPHQEAETPYRTGVAPSPRHTSTRSSPNHPGRSQGVPRRMTDSPARPVMAPLCVKAPVSAARWCADAPVASTSFVRWGAPR